jgi:cytochrome b subunit of formate dehydrogenase/succinate dehydrogenase/fumarate reductase-like Fe-S protein
MANKSKLNAIHSSYLLDDAWSPVARFRLLSRGVNDNARLMNSGQVQGDRACIACGNCVDACPVVRQNVGMVFAQNQRTSMALENCVQEECRRCYRCVCSCPQVGKELKEYAAGFRRVEKIVHFLAAFTIISLAATGITRSHYGQLLGGLESEVLRYIHRVLGLLSLIIPVLYYKLDIRHFRRTVKRIFSWGEADVLWLRNILGHLRSRKNKGKIDRYEFNPVQKVWYLFIMSFFPLLYVSGLITMVMGKSADTAGLASPKMFHMAFALSFDIMLFIHVYIKFIREWVKSGYRLFRNYQETRAFVFTADRPAGAARPAAHK